jgi:hypothetical protein
MYIVREIFHLQFGHYREVKTLIEEALTKHLLLQPAGSRVLTDFTGKSYRFILELPFATLADYEAALKQELGGGGWQDWYQRFKPHIARGEREILKLVM